MTQQTLDWQNEQHLTDFANLCNALYERELHVLANVDVDQLNSLQGKLKSLPYYIKRTASFMTQVDSPLKLDSHNGSWSAKQASKMPLSSQDPLKVSQWYQNLNINLGYVVPIALADRIVLDMVDRVDTEKQRLRTNMHGWLSFSDTDKPPCDARLLIPNKRVMMAACAGHCWQDARKQLPTIPSLRELLISCAINWQNFKVSKVI